MGLASRAKGKRGEREVANLLRQAFPGIVVRRASQADRAFQSDVYVQDGPELLRRIWWEVQWSRNPTPLAKLEQAELDTRCEDASRMPVVVWRKTGGRSVMATMRMATLLDCGEVAFGAVAGVLETVVTVELTHFLKILCSVSFPTAPSSKP